jgi:hypothetical protein
MLFGFEETGSDVVLAEHCYVGDRVDLRRSGLACKVEHAFERCQFAIDRGVLCSLVLSVVDIVSYKLTLDAVDELYFVIITSQRGYGLTTKDHLGSLTYLCGLLNSSVLDFFFKRVSTTFHGGYFAANKQFIEQLPIPSAKANQRIAIEQLVDLLLWLHQQSSVAGSDPTRPQDPAMASFFEQTINALVYELFFAEELHLAGLRVFDLLNNANLPDLDSLHEAGPRGSAASISSTQVATTG